MRRLRIGLVGAGAVAIEHISGWSLAGGVIAAVADPNPPSKDAMILVRNVPYFRSLEQMMSRKTLDVVDICTPHHAHLNQLTSLCAWPGAILVEKPIITKKEDTSVLAKFLYRRQHPVLMRTNKRFEPHIKEFARHVSDFGRARTRVRIIWRQRPEYMARRWWYRQQSVSGGGVVLGMGIHYLDLIAEYFSSPKLSSSVIRTYKCPPNAPDTTSENYARLVVSGNQNCEFEVTLSCWKPTTPSPFELITAETRTRRVRFARTLQRDAESELKEEFDYYAAAIIRGESHPERRVVLRSHRLALEAYECSVQS